MSDNPGGRQAAGASGTADPFAPWRAMYQSGEEAWSQMLDQMMGTQAFAQSMGQFLDNYLKAQEVTRQGVESNLSAMNFPTKSDLTRIAAQVVAVDAKLDDVSFAIDGLTDRLNALAQNGPVGIQNELAQLSDAVKTLSAKVEGVSTSGFAAVDAAAAAASPTTSRSTTRSRVKQESTDS